MSAKVFVCVYAVTAQTLSQQVCVAVHPYRRYWRETIFPWRLDPDLADALLVATLVRHHQRAV